MLTPKPHQERGVADVLASIEAGTRRLTLTSPTGGGKSLMISMLIEEYTRREKRSQLYTNRKMLIEQTSRNLVEDGIDHGIRAADHEFQPYYPIQISSVQTEYARCIKTDKWMLFDSDLVLVDEGHLANNEQTQSLVRKHLEAGAAVVYVTATPVDMEGLADQLIIAGTNSELRECGLLVPAMHFGAPEPDFKRWKIRVGDELTEGQAREAMGDLDRLFGHVIEWYDRTNPEKKPAVLFASGVDESRWWAQHLTEAGIPAAHIDGEDVWHDGQFYKSSPRVRQEILDGSKSGAIKVLCNRFVLREGINAPWISHCIFATVIGSLQNYLQTGGRVLRAFPGKTQCTIQDHAGLWWRFGSLNTDRRWELDLSSRMIQGAREDALREKKEREPARCSKCGMILGSRRCPTCKFTVDEYRKFRPVMQDDGKVIEHHGDIFVQKIRRMLDDTTKKWNQCYFRAKNSKNGMTFAQAEGMFFHENAYWPPRTLGLMPAFPYDFYRRVRDVPRERLNSGVRDEAAQ